MAADEQTLFSNLRKGRDEVAKSKLATADKAALQKDVDAFIAEAHKIVVVHTELMKKLESQQAERKALDAKDKALAAAAKAFPGKLGGATTRKNSALAALAAARKKSGADASIGRLIDTIQDLNMRWIDLSPFQDL
ncbi:MAG TPA: hypothetical protein VNS61_17765 [Caldimonas sp.]|nr:hypothetical protein [Caldimonas sp.]